MARVIVVPDDTLDVVLMNETVYPIHMEDEHCSLQIIERVAKAVDDAEPAGSLRALGAQVG